MPGKYSVYTDDALMEQIRTGDERAFSELYERYFSKLFNYAYQKRGDRFKAQEIVQELFVDLWLRRSELRVASVPNYLFGAAKNLIISAIRRELSQEKHLSDWQIQSSAAESSTEHQILYNDLHKHYEEGLALLPEKCRAVFLLSRSGNPNSEIAHQLQISEKTVEQHITKALRILRLNLKNHLNTVLIIVLLKYF